MMYCIQCTYYCRLVNSLRIFISCLYCSVIALSPGVLLSSTQKKQFFLHQIYAYIYIIHEFLSSTKIQKQFYVMFFIIVIHICYFIMNYRIFFQKLYRRQSTLETRKSLVVFIYVGFFGSRSEKMEGNRREIIFFHKILFVFFMIL